MAELTAEEFAKRVQDTGLMEPPRWKRSGANSARGVSKLEAVHFGHLMRRELLTNLQVERLKKGERYGYFYGKYKLLYLVGKGTFARVYRAVHVQRAGSRGQSAAQPAFQRSAGARTIPPRSQDGDAAPACQHRPDL